MGDVIYLSRYRKAKERAEKEKQAEANRVRHGRTKAEKKAVRLEQDRQAAELEGKWIEPEVAQRAQAVDEPEAP